jgi:8-oxo-dGTP diphosphatase
MQRYSLGFAFDYNKKDILLITKNRPAWQAGLWNGIGGHVEEGESALDCMVREFREETGLRTEGDQWVFLTTFQGPDFIVDTFYTCSDMIYEAESMTDEPVSCVPVQLDLIRMHSISNLPWLIAMALDVDQPRLTFTASYAPHAV